MTKTPDQDAHNAATSPTGQIPRKRPIPTGHALNIGEQDTLELNTGDQGMGNVPPLRVSSDPTSESPAHPREEPLKVTVKRRLEAEGRWAGKIELERNQMMKLARKQGMSKSEAQTWVYTELDRMYPPLQNRTLSYSEDANDSEKRTLSGAQRPVDAGQIQGLGDIPGDWPELPANASLGNEIAWVQANRLRVVEDRSAGPTVVHLDQALSPAPSWAALGWLETSIRSYAKFVDVAAKATASHDGEAEVWKRERMAIEEVRALLDEMRDEEG